MTVYKVFSVTEIKLQQYIFLLFLKAGFASLSHPGWSL